MADVLCKEDMADEEQDESAESSNRMDIVGSAGAAVSNNGSASSGAVKFSTLSKPAAKRLDSAPGFSAEDS